MPKRTPVCIRCSAFPPDIQTSSLILSSHRHSSQVTALWILSLLASQGEMMNLLITPLILDENYAFVAMLQENIWLVRVGWDHQLPESTNWLCDENIYAAYLKPRQFAFAIKFDGV